MCKIIGYDVCGELNGISAFEGRDDVRRCPVCGELLCKWDESLDGLVVSVCRYELSHTTDGIAVASARFKRVCEEGGITGLTFDELPDDSGFYSILAHEIVYFDYERRQTRFLNRCDACSRYKDVVGATPVFLREGAVIPDLGFVRTDIEFASGDEKEPLFLCGPSAGTILKQAKLRGVYVLPIEPS